LDIEEVEGEVAQYGVKVGIFTSRRGSERIAR